MPTLNTLVNFNGSDGIEPEGKLLADAAGNLFGTEIDGGANGVGTVFEIVNTSTGYATTPITLASFNGTDGEDPEGGLIADTAGDLLGTTAGGGANNDGTVFEIANTGSGYATTPITVASFNGTDGFDPQDNLISDAAGNLDLVADAAGNLFGTAGGGANGDGVVFEIANTSTGYASTPIALVSFNITDGYGPQPGLITDAAGDLFGTTFEGGDSEHNATAPFGYGTVFEIAKTPGGYASTPTVLVSFNGEASPAYLPDSSLIADAAGDLFGTTMSNTVYEIANTSTGYASTPTILATFDDTDGGDPNTGLIANAAGDLFGTTFEGGTYGYGTVYEIANTSTGYASTPITLVNFNGADGKFPEGSLIANAAGDLVGTTEAGGANNDGTAFEVSNAGFLVATTITLPAGMNNTLTVTDAMLSNEVLTIRDGANSNNTVSAAGDTAASAGRTLTYDTGAGTDSFTGGFENDVVDVSAAALVGDTLTGGSGSNTLVLTSAGTFSLGEFNNFTTIDFAAGNNTVSGSAAAVSSDTLAGGSGPNTLVLTSAGTFSLGGVSNFGTIDLAAGNNAVTLTDTTLSGGSVTIVDGANSNNTISAAGDTLASYGKFLIYDTGTGTDSFVGGWENDTVYVSAAALAGDTFTGGRAANTLILTSAGSIDLGKVSNFGTIDLASGNNTVTVTDKTLSAGSVTIVAGASGDNSISAAGDTAASAGKALTYDTGTGTDSFTGGFENDTVNVSAAALAGDMLTAGNGTNTLILASAGSINLGKVSNFGTIDLASSNNTVTVTDTTLSGGAVTLYAGASGNNTISATGDTSASKGKTLTYDAGTGTDSFTGGFENDTVNVSAAAVGGDTLTGGSGTNTLVLTSDGSVDLGGVSKFPLINLGSGNNTVTVTDTTLSGGAVTIRAGRAGASGDDSVSAAGDTAASKGKTLIYSTETGKASFAGGFETDMVRVSAATVGGDTLTGGSGNNTLMLTTAGSVDLDAVSLFCAIGLAAGNNTVTVTDVTLAGAAITMHAGASGNDSVSAAGDTDASKGKTFFYYTGTGTDSFTGGFENDVVHVSAATVGNDPLKGGSGNNTLMLTSAGSVDLGTVSRFGAIDLAAGNNTVTVTDTTLSGNGPVVMQAGVGSDNSVSAAGDTDASKGKTLIYHAGTGTDSFTGGFENDIIYAGTGLGAYTAGSGSNRFVFMADNLPTQTLDNFQASVDTVQVYGIHASNGFDLGSTDNALNPAAAAVIDPSIFIANASGDFTSSSQRFAYDTTNGQLHYSATGSNAAESLVATLIGAPAMAASDLLFAH